MKSFEHNFIEQNILLNAIIRYSSEEDQEPILIKLPTIRDSVEDANFDMFVSLLFLKVEDYQKMGLVMKIESAAQGLIALVRESSAVRKQTEYFFEKFLINSKLSSKGVLVNDIPLTEEEVEFFRKVILITYGVEKLEEEKDSVDTSKMGAAEKAIYDRQQETLRRLEEAKKRKQKVSSEDQVNLPKIIAGVMKEFTMTLEDIKDLNYYTLYYLFSYVFKIDHYDFMKRAAASGNLAKNAKIKHWLE